MQDACAFALVKLSPPALRKVLMRGSIRMIKYLLLAYPQAMGAAFLDALAPSISPATLKTLVEEVSRGQLLTPAQVRQAESEFIKLAEEETRLTAPQALN